MIDEVIKEDAIDRSGDRRDLNRLAQQLARRIEGEVRFSRHERMLYATDASIYQVEPLGVVQPASIGDVREVMRFAAEQGLPVLPRGGGTSLAGQTVNRAIVVDVSPHLDQIVSVDPAAHTACVQPGVVLDQFNRALTSSGLMFGPDVATAAHATIGGMIGNNSSGAHSVLYGRTLEHLRALEVILADGLTVRLDEGAATRDERVRELTTKVAEIVQPMADEIRRRFPRTRRRVNGYNLDVMLDQIERSSPGTLDKVNLAHLFCGAEGTLGITVEAEVGLVEAPRRTGLAIVAFDDVDDALAAVTSLLATEPAAVELIDDVIVDLARENIEYRRYVELLPQRPGMASGAVLYVEYFARDDDELHSKIVAIEDRFGSDAVKRCLDERSMVGAWKLRKAGEPLLYGLPGERKPVTFIEDPAVDPEHLPEFIRRFRRIIETHGTRAAFYAHASVGCLHVRPLVALRDDADRQVMQSIVTEVTDLVAEYGGALSGEHGDGRLRSHMLERLYGGRICDAFRAVKRVFDPENRLNPGNIVDPAPMLAQLRVQPDDEIVRYPEVETFYRYDREQGLGGAIEMCNGNGACRKMRDGTMCPSYRATRDERHATRGRGNALRLVISGQLGADPSKQAWNDPATLETLDLCLSCKACKSECPSNVDLAKLRAEYLAQSYRAAGRAPRQASAFGQIRGVNRLGSLAPRLSNALARASFVRSALARHLDIDERRSLPRVESSLYRWFESRSQATSGHDPPVVILFPDCFTTYNEPRIGRAAVRVLEVLGYSVVLPRTGCCGRAMISNGLLEQAVSTCRDTARALIAAREVTNAVAIVGCEPSCVSAITDDWPDLRMKIDSEAIASVSSRAMMIEQFIAEHWDEHPRPPGGGGRDLEILVHGHCHQKALWGMDASVDVLRRAFAAKVEPIDAGCCGMAGAFGFTRMHYDVSMAVGELALFPAVRRHPEAMIAAPGTSCRHQLLDALGCAARHPIELLAEAWLGDGSA
jgi:FAD/FMN-containing dehydrogenase/Fe-S oxidoreductase